MERLTPFLLGATTSAIGGSYMTWHAVYDSSNAVSKQLDTLGNETVKAQKALQSRVDALEGEISKLKGAINAAAAKAEG